MDLVWGAGFPHSWEEQKSCGSPPTAQTGWQHLIPPTGLLKLGKSLPLGRSGTASWAVGFSGVPWSVSGRGFFPTGSFVGARV